MTLNSNSLQQSLRTRAARSSSASGQDIVYQLKVTLTGSKPPIWRRLLVRGDTSLAVLHQILQIAMGWTDSHLHQFNIHGVEYGPPDPDGVDVMADEAKARLARVIGGEKDRFTYVYDFGDDWEHTILIEKVQPVQAGMQYPYCMTGRRSCPPEDVGGVWGYQTFLAALRNPEHEDHDMWTEWIGGDFDPEEFDADAVNREFIRVLQSGSSRRR